MTSSGTDEVALGKFDDLTPNAKNWDSFLPIFTATKIRKIAF